MSEILSILKENRKIAMANHNIYAYIWAKDGKYAFDFLDGGANGARKRSWNYYVGQGATTALWWSRAATGYTPRPSAFPTHPDLRKKHPKLGDFVGNAKAPPQAKGRRQMRAKLEISNSNETKPRLVKDQPAVKARKVLIAPPNTPKTRGPADGAKPLSDPKVSEFPAQNAKPEGKTEIKIPSCRGNKTRAAKLPD